MRPFIAYPVGMGVLAACMAGVVWAEPLGNSNFSRLLRNNTAGHFELVQDINLTLPEPNGHSRSPWRPIDSFSGTLEGNGHAIYGLNIQENRTNTNSGLFESQTGTVNLRFVDPEVVATGNGTYQGLVAGENSGNVTVVWQGGRIEHTGFKTESFSDYRYPLLGVVGQNLAGGQVEAVAQGVAQTGGHLAFIGIGAGENNGIIQAVAQSVNQTAIGSEAHIGIGAGENNGITQAVAQFVNQTVTGDRADIGIGAGANWNLTQAVVRAVNQTAIGNEAHIGIGAGYNWGTAQAVAQAVNQNVTGAGAKIGIGAGFNFDTTQAVAQAVNQTVTGDYTKIGIGAGYSGNTEDVVQAVAQAVNQTATGDYTKIGIGAGYNWGTTQAVIIDDAPNNYRYDTRLAEQQAKNTTQTEGVLTIKPEDWEHGNDNQYPMLKGLDGGFQDMQRLLPEFMRDFAQPSNTPNASWFGLDILNALERQRGVPEVPTSTLITQAPTKSLTPAQMLSSTASTPAVAMTTQTPAESPMPTTHCLAPRGTPVFQAYDNENQWLYVVIKPSLASRDLVLARYQGTMLDERFGQCGKVAYGPPSDLPDTIHGYPVTAGLLQQGSTGTHIYLLATDQARELQLFDLALSGADVDRPRFNAHRREVGLGARINAVASHNGRLYVTGKVDSLSRVLVGRYQALELDNLTREGLQDEHERGNSLALSPDGAHLYVAGIRNREAPYSIFLRKYDRSSLTIDRTFNTSGEVSVMDTNIHGGQQAVAVYKEWVYVATINAWGTELSVRRYDPENGVMDGSFVVDEIFPDGLNTIDGGVRAQVVLFTDDQYLHMVKYDRKGHIFAITYDSERELHRTTRNLSFLNVATNGLAVADGKVYLAFERSPEIDSVIGTVEVVDVDMPFLSIAGQSTPDGLPGWGWGLIGTGAMVTAVTVIAAVGIK